MNKIKYIISFLIFCSISINESKKYRISPIHNQKIRQAKSLQNNGLINQAKDIYYDLFIESPHLKEAFIPLKNILIDEDNIKKLNEIYPLYLKANNNNISAKIDVIDILIYINNNDWEKITKEIINNKLTKEKYLRSLLKIILKNNKIAELELYVNILREKRNKDFFSYELGNHYALNLSIKKSIEELILHLDYNPRKYNIIRNKILAFPEIKNITNEIKTILNSISSNNAKLILSDIYFRDKEFNNSYNLLKKYSDNELKILEFVDSLIKNKEYNFAQNIINDIINSNYNKNTIQSSIIKLAEIYEITIKQEKYNLPISSKIYKNQLLDSPFNRIDNEKFLILENAITIYDSLILSNKDIKSSYNLAQIKYKILGDLDGANTLFNNIISNEKKQNSIYSNSIIESINIMISKGQLLKAKKLLENNKNNINPKELYQIKEIQILFYQNKWDSLNLKINSFLKSDFKTNSFYNDILKIKNYLTMFNNNKDQLNYYAKSSMKIFQNKRFEAMQIINELSNNTNIEISSRMKYEYAHLLIKQRKIEESMNVLNEITNDSATTESAILLKAEIYDYILNEVSNAVELYLYFLDTYKDSIHYDTIRLRLREITS